MSVFHLVLYSTDTTEDRTFQRHQYDSADSASSRYQSYVDNMDGDGVVQAASWQKITVDNKGVIQKVDLVKQKSKATRKITRYNQKKG